MDPIRRALWYIERHFASVMTLDDIARRAGLSRFHFLRTFAHVTGMSALSYVRGRRLSTAALALASGAPDILAVALGAGYGSHEAFTRAFREMFGVTPEGVRASGTTANLELLEPFMLPEFAPAVLPEPAIREEGPFLMAGLREFRSFEKLAGIPQQWQRFAPHIGHTPGEVGGGAYGVCLAPPCGDEGYDYMTAVAVRDVDELPEELSVVRVARRRYAMFRHEDHVSKLGAACAWIFGQWPDAKLATESSPLLLIERYDNTFDEKTGYGGIQLWIPVNQ